MDGGECSTVDVYTCEIGQLRATVQAPVSGNEARVAGWGSPLGPVISVVRK